MRVKIKLKPCINDLSTIKVGDLVQCIPDYSTEAYNGRYPGARYISGDTYRVTEISTYGSSDRKEWVFWDQGEGCYGRAIRKIVKDN
jgi:hypothetical protein